MIAFLASLPALLQGPGIDYAPTVPSLRLADPVPYFAPPSWIWFGPSGQMGKEVRDFSGDGSPDVAFAFGSTTTVATELRAWRGDGRGGFTFASATPLLGVPGPFFGGPSVMAPADYDGDGVLDLVVPLWFAPGVAGPQVLRGDGAGGFSPWVVPPWGTGGILPSAGDVDGDGDPDIAITGGVCCSGSPIPGVSVAFNMGGGVFLPAPPPCISGAWQTGNNALQAELRDLDNDSILDYVGSGSVFQVLLGVGNGCFLFPQNLIYWYTVGPPANEKQYAWGDFNGDGADDLVLLASISGSVVNPIHVAVYLRASPGSSTWNLGPTFANPGWPTGIAAADLDLDGYTDFVVTEIASPVTPSTTGNRVRVYRNLGGGTSFQVTPRDQGFTWMVSSPILRDVNGDAYPDLLVNQRGMPAVTAPGFAIAVNTTASGDIEVIGSPQIGRIIHLDLEGTPLATWSLLASPNTGPSLSFPGFQGALGLDPATLFVVTSGVFPSDGNTLVPVSIPNNLALVGGIVNLQYIALVPSSPPGWFSGVTSLTVQ